MHWQPVIPKVLHTARFSNLPLTFAAGINVETDILHCRCAHTTTKLMGTPVLKSSLIVFISSLKYKPI